jgi:hypothetical protein
LSDPPLLVSASQTSPHIIHHLTFFSFSLLCNRVLENLCAPLRQLYDMPLSPNTRLGRYEIRLLLGAFATAYEQGHKLKLDEAVALALGRAAN